MRSRTLISFCVVIACLLSIGAPQASAGWTEVPALVNVQPNMNPEPTNEEIAAMIAEANKLLKQAEIKLMFDKDKSIKRNFGTPGHANGGDNKIDADEDKKLDAAGVEELEKHTGEKGEGVKIVISNEIHGKSSTLGLAAHNPDSPVIYVKWPQTAVKGGNTTAHEFGHVFTLGKHHIVDDKDNDDPADDEKADAKMHSSRKGNLMHATENGTKLTEDQIEELQKGVKGHGHAVTWLDRAWRWTKKQFNSSTVDSTILSSGLSLGSDTLDPSLLSISTDFGGGLAPGESLSIAMAIDIDENPGTGREIEGPGGTFMPGVDRTLMINVTGDPENGGSITAELLDGLGNPLPIPVNAEFENILKAVDNDPDEDETIDVYDQVRVELNPADLGVGPGITSCPVQFFTFGDPSLPALDASGPLLVDLNSPLDPGPQVVLGDFQAEAGDFVTIDGLEFFPDAADILIQFDDDEVMRLGAVDPMGQFNGVFQVPFDAENGMYFITASTLNPADPEQMQYGFAMLEVTPEPGTMALLAMGAAAILRRRKRS
jgi:hypothetical protein